MAIADKLPARLRGPWMGTMLWAGMQQDILMRFGAVSGRNLSDGLRLKDIPAFENWIYDNIWPKVKNDPEMLAEIREFCRQHAIAAGLLPR